MIRSIEFRAMNTVVTLAAEGQRDIEGMQATKDFVDECEQRFSRFLPASEVTELNHSAGEWLQVSNDLMEMIQLSQSYFQETRGLFDPSILLDLKQAGYDRSMDQIRASGGTVAAQSFTGPSQLSFADVSIDPLHHMVLLPQGMEIDLGGLAKGWIVKRSAQLLHTFSEVCGVSAGGDILFLGQPSDGLDWDVYLEDPRDPAQMLAQLHISEGAVTTSSVMKRTWRQGGNPRHHLIDPRTRKPAETEWLSVTVIYPDVVAADVYAKAILIGGPTAARALTEKHPGLSFIAVEPQGNLVGSPNFKEYIYEPASSLFLSADTPR